MKRCLILGGGVSGRAAFRLAALAGYTPEIVSDGDGRNPELCMKDASLIVVSPGVKPASSALYQAASERARSGQCEFISELEFGFRHLPSPERLLAITGTNGKTTTTELTVSLLKSLGIPAVPAGNIGIPLADVAADLLEKKLPPDSLPVVEVSSFQLERVERFAPAAAVLLNLESDHIDRYPGGFEEYSRVKRNIFRSVPADGRISGLSMQSPDFSPRVVFQEDSLMLDGKFLLDVSLTKLNARHNRENLAAALELILRVVPSEKLFQENFRDAVKSFQPGGHRMETVEEYAGITCINDSKATNPAAVLAALRSLPDSGRSNVILLLGGLDKGMDFSPFATIAAQVKFAVLFGECRHKIAAALPAGIAQRDCGNDFECAVRHAVRAACSGDIVLLSPGCASMDMFKNYEERGNLFAALAQRFIRQEK